MIGCIVQARVGSSRLPRKVMKLIDGKNPVIHYVLKQLEYSKFLKQIVVATTNNPNDDQIVDYLEKNNHMFFRGDEKDVLDRFYLCSKKFSFSIIVRITSDNPLIDPSIVDTMIEEFEKHHYDYMTNSIPRTFPFGTEVEIFTFNALENAWKNAKNETEREHVTPYFYNNPEKFKIKKIESSYNMSGLRWTLDEYSDFILIQNIIKKIKKSPILLDDILELHQKEPQLFKINENVKHKIL